MLAFGLSLGCCGICGCACLGSLQLGYDKLVTFALALTVEGHSYSHGVEYSCSDLFRIAHNCKEFHGGVQSS
jgi:hypothetical protein